MSQCHTFKRKQVYGEGGQICHTVTLLKGSKYMGRGDKYVTVSHSKHKGKFSKEGGQICHTVTL